MISDWPKLLKDVEDRLFRRLELDVWERVVYYHLLRQTHGEGQEIATLSMLDLSAATGMSDTKAREILRSLDRKGCIEIQERSRLGHSVRVRLPAEILPSDPEPPAAVNLEAIDFFTGRRHVNALLIREGGRCFYCLKELERDACELDHVVCRKDTDDNSYRNVVIACHDCNKRKLDLPAEDFIRSLYRRALLGDAEFQERMQALSALQAGELVPDVVGV